MANILFGLHCPDCGKKINEIDTLCPHCGTNLDVPLEKNEAEALAHSYLEKAQKLFDSQRNTKQALIECEQALEYLPESAEAHNLHGLILDELGRVEDAMLAYREAIRLNPDFEDPKANLEDAENVIGTLAQEYLDKAQVAYSSLRNMNKALLDCEQAIKFAPLSAEAHNLQGLILDDMGRFDEAMLAYQEAIRLKPDYQDAIENLKDAESEYKNPNPKIGASFGIRLGAQVIDLITHNVIWLVLDFALGVLIGLYGAARGISTSILVDKMQASTSISYILALIGYIMYHTICEGLHGATLGKLIFNIHVLKEDGSPMSIGSAFIRSFAFYVDQFFFGAVAGMSMSSSNLKQRLGDKWAKTIVVQRSSLPQFEWPSGLKFFTAFLVAIGVDGLICIISNLFKFVSP